MLDDSTIKRELSRDWDIVSERYDTNPAHGVLTSSERALWKAAVSRAIPGTKGMTVLDVGCGTGEMSLILAEMGCKVTGLDISPKMIEKAREKARAKGLSIDFKVGDAENPDLTPGSCEVVFSRHVLWTLPHPETAFGNWRKVLNAGGRLVVVDSAPKETPGGDVAVSSSKANHHHYSQELTDALPNVGGTPVERSQAYFAGAGFGGLRIDDLAEIRNEQMKSSHGKSDYLLNKYYMISGVKNV